MRYLVTLLTVFFTAFSSFGQADCNDASFGCTIGSFITNSSGDGLVADLPGSNNISNPSSNPGSAGNSGCLLSGENDPTWIILTVSSTGFLEFTLGESGGNGFYDWALWPYYDAGDPESINGADACSEIQNNLLPPAACNWNSSGSGYTGMVQQGNLPAGAVQGNFENSFIAQPGEQYILCFSNFSGLVGANVPIFTGTDIPGNGGSTNSADITCDPSSLETTVCFGDVVSVTLDDGGIPNPTFTFLNNAGDVVSGGAGPDFDILPSDTTEYLVEISNGTITDTVSVLINVAFPPSPDAGIDFVVCNGATGNLNGTAGNSGNTIEWNYTGPGTITFTPDNETLNAGISTNTPGTYIFELSETNGVCPDELDNVSVLFEEPTLTALSQAPSCFGGSDGEISINSTSAVSYSFDNGVTWQANSVSTVFTAGNYDVCVETINGCVTCENVTVDEGVEVLISVSNDTTVCENGEATLSANATGGNTFYYHWGHIPSLEASQPVLPTAQTNYDVYAENEDGCVSSTETVAVDVLPSLLVTSSPSQTICPGESINIVATGSAGNGGPYNYVWTDPSGNVLGTTNVFNASPTVTTTYTVTVTDNCESSAVTSTSEVVVAPIPDVQFSVLDGELCSPATFELVNETDPALVDEVYWYISDGQTFIATDSIEVDILKAGKYNVQMVIVTPDGCIDSAGVNGMLTVYPKPRADFTYIPNPVTILNTEVQFQNYSQGAVNYEWSIEEGNPDYSFLENPTVNLPEGEVGDYDVDLFITSEFDCKDTIRKIITVVPEVLIFTPNAFTPDGDEFNSVWKPVIQGVDLYGVTIEIFNRWGEKIWESHDLDIGWDGTYGIGLGRVRPGTYVWKIRASDIINDDKYEWEGHVSVIY
jgi:gliding motility-associated-like protein